MHSCLSLTWLAYGTIGTIALVQVLVAQWGFPWRASPSAGFIVPFLAVVSLAVVALLDRQARAAKSLEQRLRGILEASPDGILAINPQGTIVYANPQVLAMLGYKAEEVVGQPVDLVLPAQPGLGDAGSPREMLGRCKNGLFLSLEILLSPERSAGQESLRTLFVKDVTQAKQTRETLQQQEAFLRLVVSQMPAILWTTDTKLQITSSMGAGLAALNLEPNQIIGLTMLENLGRENYESTPIAAHLRAVRGESLNYEMEWKGRCFQVRVEPLRDPPLSPEGRGKDEGDITGTIGLVLDITDRKQTMTELQARARQQQAVAQLGQRALDRGEPGVLLNDAARLVADTLGVDFCQLYEVLPDKTVRWQAGTGWKRGQSERGDILPQGQVAYTLQTQQPVLVEDVAREARFKESSRLRERGVVSGLSALLPGKEGSHGVITVHTTAKRQFTEDDVHFLQAVANVLAAALQRKEAEDSRNRLVAILEATPDVVAIVGVDQGFLYLNQAGREKLGLGATEDLHNRNIADFYAEAARQRFVNEQLSQARTAGVCHGESQLRTRAGLEIPISQVVLAHRAPDGAVEFFSIIGRDMRERLHLEEQFRQAQKMEAVGRLAGGVAHDFNNLLCIITGYCDLLLQQTTDDDERHGLVQEVKKAGDRAAALTRQLLAFSRKQMLIPCVLNLNALIANTETMLRRLIGADVVLDICLDPSLHPVKADPGQIEQILMNLAVNSRDALPEGGKITITTANVVLDDHYAQDHAEVVPGSYALLSVRDTGCGMDAKVQTHLFEPFFTTKAVGKGTGLGLATVYGIVKQSGGHIAVHSQPGHGTVFKIYLPRIHETVAAAENKVLAPTPAPPRGQETILLVEDEDGVRRLARQALEQAGYHVLEASDGQHALRVCRDYGQPIHLLVSDVVMPHLSGGKLAQHITTLHPDLKVLFVSGYTDSALVQHGVVTGEVDCLLKPFTPEALTQKVRAVLDREKPAIAVREHRGAIGDQDKPARERRRLPRRPPRGSVAVECRPGTYGLGPNVAVQVLDISVGGVAVLTKTPLQKGQEVEVVLSRKGTTGTIKRTAVVAWALPPGDQGYCKAGLEFRSRLSYPDFDTFADIRGAKKQTQTPART